MHFVKYFLPLAFNLNASVLSNLRDFLGESYKVDFHSGNIYNHHHSEETLYDCLGDIKDVYVVLCQIGADFSDDTYSILSDYSYDGSVHSGNVFVSYRVIKQKSGTSHSFIILPSVLR